MGGRDHSATYRYITCFIASVRRCNPWSYVSGLPLRAGFLGGGFEVGGKALAWRADGAVVNGFHGCLHASLGFRCSQLVLVVSTLKTTLVELRGFVHHQG